MRGDNSQAMIWRFSTGAIKRDGSWATPRYNFIAKIISVSIFSNVLLQFKADVNFGSSIRYRKILFSASYLPVDARYEYFAHRWNIIMRPNRNGYSIEIECVLNKYYFNFRTANTDFKNIHRICVQRLQGGVPQLSFICNRILFHRCTRDKGCEDDRMNN